MSRRHFPNRLTGAFVGMAFSLAGVSAQGILSGGLYSLFGHVAGGSGRSEAGAFSVTSDIGPANAGISTGGQFTLIDGLPQVFTMRVDDFKLEVHVNGPFVSLSWPIEAALYKLESSSTLGQTAVWQPVTSASAGNIYTIQATQSALFYRLRRP